MIKIGRYFSTLYPYHTIAKPQAQKLIDFPLQFYSENYIKNENKLKASYNDIWDVILKGATYGCGMFLSLLAKQNFKDLEDLVEWKMYQTLKSSIKSYKDLGCTITSVGSTENPKVEILDFHTYKGVLLPYRNLNLETSKYKIRSCINEEPFPTFHDYSTKNIAATNKEVPDFSQFESLNLKEISILNDPEIYKEDIDLIRLFLERCPLNIEVFDIGYTSSLKLLVKDKEGKIIEGTNDENKMEFHSFRMESWTYEENLMTYTLDPKDRFKKFLKANFEDILDEFIISDVDGFMNGNPFTDD